jgi:NAD-dependent histone deacetylase SIR2
LFGFVIIIAKGGIDASRVSRSARAISIGTLRPAIVLYEENHPFADEIGGITAYDMSRSPELLLIMGTSLKVHGFKALVKDFAKSVHAKGGIVVYVNATAPSKEWEGVIDYHIMGETDVWVGTCEAEWRRVRPGDWEHQTNLDGDVVPVIKSIKGKGKAKSGLHLGTSSLQLTKCSCSYIEPNSTDLLRPSVFYTRTISISTTSRMDII